jgi:hypothetical protein
MKQNRVHAYRQGHGECERAVSSSSAGLFGTAKRLCRVQAYYWGREACEQALGFFPKCRADHLLTHPLSLRSAYAECLGGREPAYTSANARAADVCDYMAYTPEAIAPADVDEGGAHNCAASDADDCGAACGADDDCNPTTARERSAGENEAAVARAAGEPMAHDGGTCTPEKWVMRPRRVLNVPPAWSCPSGGPHVAMASDHVALVVDLDIVLV